MISHVFPSGRFLPDLPIAETSGRLLRLVWLPQGERPEGSRLEVLLRLLALLGLRNVGRLARDNLDLRRSHHLSSVRDQPTVAFSSADMA